MRLDGKGESLWRQVTNLDARKRSPAFVLWMESTARDVGAATGKQKSREADGVGASLTVLRNYIALDAMDAVCQYAAQFLHFRKTAQKIGEPSVEFDLLRYKAEGQMKMGLPLPMPAQPRCVHRFRTRFAQTSLVLSSTRWNVAIKDSRQ